MARSDETAGARRYAAAGLLLPIVAASVSACSTTQDEAARLQLNAARIRAGETRTVVRAVGSRLRVERLAVVSDSRGSAFIVTLRNPSHRAVADLPISIGVREPHRGRAYLNAQSAPGLDSYFDSHLPSVAASASLTWVYTTGRSLSSRTRPFALVGDTSVPVVTRAGEGTPPTIRARTISTASAGGRSRAEISLHNTASVPQYQLQVYAVGVRGSREVAAGELTVPHLGSHGTETLTLPIIGPLEHVRLELTAVPTIFQ